MPKNLIEKSAMCIMLSGVVMVSQPLFHALFQWGFLVTIAGIVLFTIAGHLPDPPPPSESTQGDRHA